MFGKYTFKVDGSRKNLPSFEIRIVAETMLEVTMKAAEIGKTLGLLLVGPV